MNFIKFLRTPLVAAYISQILLALKLEINLVERVFLDQFFFFVDKFPPVRFS